MNYPTKAFNLPALAGLSPKQIEVHLGLYAGYVKHVNLVGEKLAELGVDAEKNAYAIMEVRRRLGFEWAGMRNHELYFAQLETGAQTLSGSELQAKIVAQFGSYEEWLAGFKKLAMTRGIGWAMLYYDAGSDTLVQEWVDEHHIGVLTGLPVLLALDMWEHAYMVDLTPAEKATYVDAFFANLNWSVPEARLDNYLKSLS